MLAGEITSAMFLFAQGNIDDTIAMCEENVRKLTKVFGAENHGTIHSISVLVYR